MTQKRKYTREVLAEAAEHCSSIDGVIAFLGAQPHEHLRRYLLRRFAHYGIDVSHFPHHRSDTVATRPPSDMLRECVANSRSLAELLRKLGRRDNGHQRKPLRQWIAEEGLTTAHFLGQGHQRGMPSTTPSRRPTDVLVKHDGKRRTKTVLLRRALSAIGVPERCAECGTSPVWRGNPITLEIDHINGDWSDDRAENLRFLCPNCHAVTSTWCRGGTRRTAHPQDLLTTSTARPVR
jgi:hypothetical protein